MSQHQLPPPDNDPALVEALARATAPAAAFARNMPDDQVSGQLRKIRETHRQVARAVLASGLVTPVKPDTSPTVADYALCRAAAVAADQDAELVEQLARAADPVLFGGRPDDQVGPATRYAREDARREVRRVLTALVEHATRKMHDAIGTSDEIEWAVQVPDVADRTRSLISQPCYRREHAEKELPRYPGGRVVWRHVTATEWQPADTTDTPDTSTSDQEARP